MEPAYFSAKASNWDATIERIVRLQVALSYDWPICWSCSPEAQKEFRKLRYASVDPMSNSEAAAALLDQFAARCQNCRVGVALFLN